MRKVYLIGNYFYCGWLPIIKLDISKAFHVVEAKVLSMILVGMGRKREKGWIKGNGRRDSRWGENRRMGTRREEGGGGGWMSQLENTETVIFKLTHLRFFPKLNLLRVVFTEGSPGYFGLLRWYCHLWLL